MSEELEEMNGEDGLGDDGEETPAAGEWDETEDSPHEGEEGQGIV